MNTLIEKMISKYIGNEMNVFCNFTFTLVAYFNFMLLGRWSTLSAMRVTFNVTTMENSLGKRLQFTSSWEEGKLMEVWGLDKWTPLNPPACLMSTPGTCLEVSLSRTKDKRSRGIKSAKSKQINRWGILSYNRFLNWRSGSEMINVIAKSLNITAANDIRLDSV